VSPKEKKGTPNATISPNELSGYEDYPQRVRKIIDTALELTTRNLTYSYGSTDPANGGMDCSGFVYYVLRQNEIKEVPRDSSQQYVWVRKTGNFRAVISRNVDSFELDALKPADLLFWTGTYSIERDPPITHSMIYVGKEKGTGRRIMVGASDGRSFDGKQRYGVSVFDFKLSKPKADKDAKLSPLFVGYGRIPGLGED
jgi:peptidoglycan DL-endopeptidase CwlO